MKMEMSELALAHAEHAENMKEMLRGVDRVLEELKSGQLQLDALQREQLRLLVDEHFVFLKEENRRILETEQLRLLVSTATHINHKEKKENK